MKIIKRILCILMVALLALPGALASTGAKVNSASARLYSSDSSSSNSVPLEKGTSVSIKDVSGSWAKVSVKGVTGYVPVKYLNTSSREPSHSGGL
jgi:hypothetical protein